MSSLLSPELVRALSRLRLRAPTAVQTFHQGESRSLSPGSSVEFSDYREYEPGDDYRYIDWNIYARLDRLFVKIFTEERNRSLLLLRDTSESMAIGDPPKELYARQLAAALGYVALWRGDEVRHAEVTTKLRWRSSWWRGRHRVRLLMEQLGGSVTHGETALGDALKALAPERQGQGRIAVLISDLLDPHWENALATLSRWRGSSVLVHLLAPSDWNPAERGELELVDAESGRRLVVSVDDEAAGIYTGVARRWMHEVRERCAQLGITCFQVDTSFPLEQLLLSNFREGGLLR